MKRLWSVLAVCSLGCAAGSQVVDQISVAPEDHDGYRAYRSAETLEQKLQAAWRYIKAQPQGRYGDEVRAWFLNADREYRRLAQDRPDLLQGYLRLLPDAPNAPLVRDRLAELELAKTLKSRRELELTVQSREFESQLAAAERQRDAFLRAVSQWIGRLAVLGPWDVPVGDLAPDFVTLFTLQEPGARCDAASCVKQLSYPYVLPDRGAFAVRSAEIDVVLGLEQGRVRRAELAGYGLFDRMAEASQLTQVAPGDPLARAEAIGRAVQLTGQALDSRFPAARCGREAISPVVLERECDGVRVRVIAAESPERPDRVEFTPSSPAAPPGSP